jgi:hypothetical protein
LKDRTWFENNPVAGEKPIISACRVNYLTNADTVAIPCYASYPTKDSSGYEFLPSILVRVMNRDQSALFGFIAIALECDDANRSVFETTSQTLEHRIHSKFCNHVEQYKTKTADGQYWFCGNWDLWSKNYRLQELLKQNPRELLESSISDWFNYFEAINLQLHVSASAAAENAELEPTVVSKEPVVGNDANSSVHGDGEDGETAKEESIGDDDEANGGNEEKASPPTAKNKRATTTKKRKGKGNNAISQNAKTAPQPTAKRKTTKKFVPKTKQEEAMEEAKQLGFMIEDQKTNVRTSLFLILMPSYQCN